MLCPVRINIRLAADHTGIQHVIQLTIILILLLINIITINIHAVILNHVFKVAHIYMLCPLRINIRLADHTRIQHVTQLIITLILLLINIITINIHAVILNPKCIHSSCKHDIYMLRMSSPHQHSFS